MYQDLLSQMEITICSIFISFLTNKLWLCVHKFEKYVTKMQPDVFFIVTFYEKGLRLKCRTWALSWTLLVYQYIQLIFSKIQDLLFMLLVCTRGWHSKNCLLSVNYSESGISPKYNDIIWLMYLNIYKMFVFAWTINRHSLVSIIMKE